MSRAGLSELNAFLAVAEKQSFSGAAKILGVSPSALSHSMRNLEARLQLRLFNRTTRSVALTEAGEQLFKRLRPVMLELEEAVNEVTALQNQPAGTVRISASESSLKWLITHVVPGFVREYPQVHLDFVADSRLVDIVADGFDAGIRVHDDIPQDMIAVRFGPDIRMRAVAAPAYLAEHPAPQVPDDLKQHRCIRFRFASGSLFRWEFEKRDKSLNLDVQGPMTLDNIGLMLEAALAGVGIAWVPEYVAAEHIARGALVSLLEPWCPTYPGVSLYYPANRHPPQALMLFARAVRDWAQRQRANDPPYSLGEGPIL
ncbi:LysR substrate-binding domain-containing protein [Pseudomonas sp. NPDC007930]|uniref:LysR family transcriptional regulator n=1 Tax=Pseudomonas sp. NPDC007930 TaxID=3364417 RepID=UPI0036E4E7B4